VTVNSLPSGFRFDSASLLVNEGPTDTAAGIFGTLDAAALWSRQVLTDGQLRAVAITLPDTGPEPFQAVHAVAERTAEDLGVGAVEVAVCWLKSAETRLASRLTAAGWAVAGYGTAADFVLLVTDAVVPAAELRKALTDAWRDSDTVLLLASGASGQVPDAAEFAATLAALRVDLACPKGGAA
jgi:glutamate N-acetyltransferase/amino-acid N-acetyltransferase